MIEDSLEAESGFYVLYFHIEGKSLKKLYIAYLITNLAFLLRKTKRYNFLFYRQLAFTMAKTYLCIVISIINPLFYSVIDMENFGTNLKQFRSENGLSQEAFAAKIGVHVTNLSKYERSKSVPSLEIAEKMATVLDTTLDELVYGKQNEKARIQISDNELLSLFNKTQSLNDDQKKTVVDLLSAFLLKANLTKQLA